jgi:hypothetical protein
MIPDYIKILHRIRKSNVTYTEDRKVKIRFKEGDKYKQRTIIIKIPLKGYFYDEILLSEIINLEVLNENQKLIWHRIIPILK